MNLPIGESIRRLRRERGLTQEELAEKLSVSFQAVSKWETGVGLPDLAQIPRIAGVFGVTTDAVFAYDLAQREQQVESICQEAFKFRFTDPRKSREILEKGLEEFPDNEIILNNVLCVIDYRQNPDEMILLASRLSDKARLDDVRYDALWYLSYAYKAKGELDAAEAALEQIPEIYFTKLEEQANVLEGEKRVNAAKSQKWLSIASAVAMMEILAEELAKSGRTDASREELRRAAAILDAVKDDPDYDRDLDALAESLHGKIDR